MQGATDVVSQANQVSNEQLARKLAVVDTLEEAVASHLAAVQATLQLCTLRSGDCSAAAAAGAGGGGPNKQRPVEKTYQENVPPGGNAAGGRGDGIVGGKRVREERPCLVESSMLDRGVTGSAGDEELQLLGAGAGAADDYLGGDAIKALLQEEWLVCLAAQADLDLAVMHL
jgi:hypothetical protein